MGVGASMGDIPLFDFKLSTSDNAFEPVEPNTEFTVPKDKNSTGTPDVKYLYPVIFPDVEFGIPRLDIEVWTVSNETSGTSLTKNYGRVWEYEDRPRKGTVCEMFNGTVKGGSRVPEGIYALRSKALKIFGNRDSEDDWQVKQSVPFGLRYV